MLRHMETQNVDELLSEADELLQQVHSDVLNDLEEAHRLEFEKHAQNLREIKAKVREKSEKEGAPEPNSGSNGMHEAILDIVKAMHSVKRKGKARNGNLPGDKIGSADPV